MRKILPILFTAIFISACISVGTKQPADTTTGQQTSIGTKTEETTPEGGVIENAVDMATALASGGPYKCTYTRGEGQSETWIKGEKYLSTITAENNVYNTISDGTWIYAWTDVEGSGMKFNIREMESLKDETPPQGYTSIEDIKNAANTECTPAVIDDSIFTPPSEVEFQDMGETMRQLKQLSEQMNQSDEVANACSVCYMITEQEMKQECLETCKG